MLPYQLDIALLAFIPGLINLTIFIYSYFFLPQSKLSNAFSMLVFSAMVWQISEGFLKLTQDINTAKNLYIIAQAGSLIVIASCLYFSLIFTKFIVNMKSSLVSFFIFFPAIFFIISNILQWTNTEFTYSSSYGFLNTTDSTIYSLESLYISICGIATTLLLINYWINQKDARSGLFTVGFLIPFIQGLITEIIFLLR